MARSRGLSRREVLLGTPACATASLLLHAPALANAPPIRFGLTPVFLTSDLALLAGLQGYLEHATGRLVQLFNRRTYQEITALLVSRQLDAAWICGYPYVAYRHDLSLVAVPSWRGQTKYQAYLIARADQSADGLRDLRGAVHAFSDPDSNSGYLVTRAALQELGASPADFFRYSFFAYGHRNVIRAVAAGVATSGSVDGYVYEVLRETEPDLVRATRVVTRSEWLGFPPVACPAIEASSETTARLRSALLEMELDPRGRAVLAMLRLDGFREETPEAFDGIAAIMRRVKGLSE